jgi:mannose-6-phosphate isomerase-like protein (cupin superfamily)
MKNSFSNFSETLPKNELDVVLTDEIESLGFTIVDKDFAKPWGGFYRLDDSQTSKFIAMYFSDIELLDFARNAPMSPKFLVVEPHKKLSWQVHERRSECWKILRGPVGVARSESDQQPPMPEEFRAGDTVMLPVGMRHRLIGLGTRGLVAEIWVHTDPQHFSDEQDIRRIEDDFGR